MHLHVAHIASTNGYKKPEKMSKKQLIHAMAITSLAERRVKDRNAAKDKFAVRLHHLEEKEKQLANDKNKV